MSRNFETLTTRAAALGAEHGQNAASWVFDGNTSAETYRVVLDGLDNGDPAVYDSLPDSPLSGEWTDSLTPASLAREVDPEGYASDITPEDIQELCDAYENAWHNAMTTEVERVARLHLSAD